MSGHRQVLMDMPETSAARLAGDSEDRSEALEARSGKPRLKILALYAQPYFWSMGEGKGAEVFTRLPASIAARGHRVMVSMPLPDQAEADHGPASLPRAVSSWPEMYHGFELYRAPTSRSFVPDAGVPLVRRLARRFSRWSAYQRWAVRAVRPLCQAHPPDLVLGMGAFEAPAAYRIASRLRVPCVVRLFGNNLSTSVRHPLRVYANFPEVLAIRTPADLLMLTDDGADGEAVARKFGVRARRFIHIRNGVDFDLFRPGPGSPALRRRFGVVPGQPLLLTVTRLYSEKRLERAIEAMRGLLPAQPGATLVVLGSGREEARLKQLAAERGVGERVFFPGPILHEDLPDWYRSADIVLSLLDRTNASNPVFEAMACGRPVVALDTGTTYQVVEDGHNGVLVPRSDLPRLPEILAGLIENPRLREELGAEAARRIRTMLLGITERMDLEIDILEDLVWSRQGK